MAQTRERMTDADNVWVSNFKPTLKNSRLYADFLRLFVAQYYYLDADPCSITLSTKNR